MSILAKAPLIEVIFEIRWGLVKADSSRGEREYHFPGEETDFFFGQFKMIATSSGFSFIERTTPEIQPSLPHVVIFRFRRAPSTWPCYQIGLGVFSVNQINDGYEWERFKLDILNGIEYLNKGYPNGIENLKSVGIELRYRDAFILNENERPVDFLKNKMKLSFDLPDGLLNSEYLDNTKITGTRVAFNLDIVNPIGKLVLDLRQAKINGQPGFVLDTRTRSQGNDVPNLIEKDSFSQWLEGVHDIQRLAFKELIDPLYARTFK
ncbi:MAG: TIGR04255 family protein [Desulfobaccales bacterium]